MILWVRYSCPYLHSMRERFGAAPTQFTDRDGETYGEIIWPKPGVFITCPGKSDLTFIRSEEAARKYSPRHDIGATILTGGVRELLDRSGENPYAFFNRHERGDWGTADEVTVKRNEWNLRNDKFPLESRYMTSVGVGVVCLTQQDPTLKKVQGARATILMTEKEFEEMPIESLRIARK
jgi:hypothetical protein